MLSLTSPTLVFLFLVLHFYFSHTESIFFLRNEWVYGLLECLQCNGCCSMSLPSDGKAHSQYSHCCHAQWTKGVSGTLSLNPPCFVNINLQFSRILYVSSKSSVERTIVQLR